tara:strand:+ start:1026 stop:2186 length:1161 start_codon:yes stop_codon:yes gene_type:complete
MIRPVYFDTDRYFCQKKLAKIENGGDICHGSSTHGPKQCVIQNTCSQINYHGLPWNILTVPHIKIEDAINGNYDTDIYLEITTAMWCFLKDRSWVKGKKIIITNYAESWLRGMEVLISPNAIIDSTVINDIKLAKESIVVRDNVSDIDGVRCVPYHNFYLETREQYGDLKWIPWSSNYEQTVYDNIDSLGNKDKLYTALLGNNKLHRDDFWEKIKNAGLSSASIHKSSGIVGGFGYQPAPYDVWAHEFEYHRYVAKEWVCDAELWVAHETHYSAVGMDQNHPNTPMTEKIWKPVCYGMPFLINAHPDIIKGIEDLGYNTFTSVFGDYIDMDYSITNDNIIHIIENFYNYPVQKLRKICLENFERWKQLDENNYNNLFWKQLNTTYE